MVDTARALLDELMGRNRNLGPSDKIRKVNWDDPDFCQYYMVKFCPHDLFVNTRADLGQCPKLHDEEAKRMYESSRAGARKRQYEDDFLRFCNNMISEVDRKIQKGRQRLLLMSKGEGGPIYVSKFQEQLNNLNARIKKLLNEAEEAGHRGDVDQAQGLMKLCEQLKEEKEALINQHDTGASIPVAITTSSVTISASPTTANGSPTSSIKSNSLSTWAAEINSSQEKQMEVCEVCGAFLIVGDAQQRIEDHLTGKQHLGYSKLRKAIDDLQKKRQKEREDEDKRREEERRPRTENGSDRSRKDKERPRERDHRSREFDDIKRRSAPSPYNRDDRRAYKERFRGRDYRSYETDRRDRERDRKRSERDRKRSRSRSRNRR